MHMAQMKPLPLTVFCFSKIQIDFIFLVPAHLGNPGQMSVLGSMSRWGPSVCVCVCVRACVLVPGFWCGGIWSWFVCGLYVSVSSVCLSVHVPSIAWILICVLDPNDKSTFCPQYPNDDKTVLYYLCMVPGALEIMPPANAYHVHWDFRRHNEQTRATWKLFVEMCNFFCNCEHHYLSVSQNQLFVVAADNWFVAPEGQLEHR